VRKALLFFDGLRRSHVRFGVYVTEYGLFLFLFLEPSFFLLPFDFFLLALQPKFFLLLLLMLF